MSTFLIILGVIVLVGVAGGAEKLLLGFILGVPLITAGIIIKVKNKKEERQWRKEEEEKARRRSELEQRVAAGDLDAKKELIEMGTEAMRYVHAVGILPDDAEIRAFDIIRNAVIRQGGSQDFKARSAPPSENSSNFRIWKKWFESSKSEDIWLTFVSGHYQNYTDLNGRTQNGDICNIEFRVFLKMPPETVPIIANEAEQEIKGYLSNRGLSFRK